MVTAPSTQLLCAGEPSTIHATNLYADSLLSYNWSPSGYLDSITVLEPAATFPAPANSSYTLYATHEAGCHDTAEVNVVVLQNTNPMALAGSDIYTCPGKPVTLVGDVANGLGNISYQWSLPGGEVIMPFSSIQSLTVIPTVTTTLVLEVQDAASCNGASDEVTIVVDPALGPSVTVESNEDALCAGDSIVLSTIVAGDNPAYQFEWASGQQMQNITEFPSANSYSNEVTVTDAEGCVASSSIQLNIPEPVVTTVAPYIVVCSGTPYLLGDNASVIGGIPPYSYQWPHPNTLDDPTAEQPIACLLYTSDAADD